eukprot:CAMPEP_0117019262 /NCGR_PEP_ID=MMETSP0472-20121206/14810_1 /TAXON_ID=693140 ORGANISM="Tiarina fusus, Strain LIS" /NCGR_SAMPLE_ID=MMETSP0472 /ASSEMBLY_ACC=CAM_ASM_000603 /LENGTH=236 /DNA_ID=CAMNT_0004724191 /DNA_START=115 /DNA_END=825 /DNA_ORIENTATION=-
MGNCCTTTSADEKQSYEEFKKADADNDKVLSKDELGSYIDSHAQLWAMLGVNLNLDETQCREIATDVAFHLAVGEKEQRILNKEEFHRFREKYVINPQGSQEFFHRTVFAAFDKDSNGVLDRKELDHFLDIFYKADSIFAGDKRLPKKRKLRKIVLDKLDANNDGLLSFDEIRGLLSGNIDLMGLTAGEKTAKEKRTSDAAKKRPKAKPPSADSKAKESKPKKAKKPKPKQSKKKD